MTPEQIEEFAKNILQAPILLSIVGGIVSLLTSYVPGFREWYAAMLPEQKSLGQVGIITVIVILAGVLSWAGVFVIIPPGLPGVLILIFSWVSALQANQATYSYSSQIASVMMIKDKQKNKLLLSAKDVKK